MFADIVLPRNLLRAFTYHIPLELQGMLQVGSWVFVPFGQTIQLAMVIKVFDSEPPFSQDSQKRITLKHILALAGTDSSLPIDSSLIALAHDLSEYYLAPLGACLRLMQPPLNPKARVERRLLLTNQGKQALCSHPPVNPVIADIVSRLSRARRGLVMATLKKHIPEAVKVIQQLKRRGWIHEEYTVKLLSSSDLPTTHSKPSNHGLDLFQFQNPGNPMVLESEVSPFQSVTKANDTCPSWRHQVNEALTKRAFHEFLLRDTQTTIITFFLQATQDTLAHHRSTLIITPNLEHAMLLWNQVRKQWSDLAILYHKNLPTSQRMQIWDELHHGATKIVIGTRSALFLPLPSLGLICIDQEEHILFKEQQSPYYHAREVARMIARRKQSILILGTSSPSLETYHAFSKMEGQSFLPAESTLQSSPDIQLVSLNHASHPSSLSLEMREGIQGALDRNGRILIFLNRKGFSRSLLCKACGYAPSCQRCQIPLAVYKIPPQLLCPYCGHKEFLPTTCSQCTAAHLEPRGLGTERMEEIIRQQFPMVSIKRFDRDAILTMQEAFTIREQFHRRDIQILIGTQMMVSGLSLSPAHFVGIPYADAGLHFPDFRSAERVYLQLRRVIDLAKPQQEGGHVVLQTYLPTHHAIQSIALQDPTIFYHHELAFREALGYPPFSHVILLHVTGKTFPVVEAAARKWASRLETELSPLPCHPHTTTPSLLSNMVLGPIHSPQFHRKEGPRVKILVKALHLDQTRRAIRVSRQQMEQEEGSRKLQFSINVDPEEVF